MGALRGLETYVMYKRLWTLAQAVSKAGKFFGGHDLLEMDCI